MLSKIVLLSLISLAAGPSMANEAVCPNNGNEVNKAPHHPLRPRTAEFVRLSYDDCDWEPTAKFAIDFRKATQLPPWNEEMRWEDPLQCAISNLTVDLWESNQLCDQSHILSWSKAKGLIRRALAEKIRTDEEFRKSLYPTK